MVETSRPLFISFASKITREGENGEPVGTLEVFTQIQDCPVTDEELLEIKRIQAQAAEKIDALFKNNTRPVRPGQAGSFLLKNHSGAAFLQLPSMVPMCG